MMKERKVKVWKVKDLRVEKKGEGAECERVHCRVSEWRASQK